MNNRFKKYVTLSTIFLLFCLQLLAQNKRTNNWYFGFNAGVNFNNNPPTALTDGILNTREGCATISDENGNLLFYTDGSTVYDKNHNIMLNGQGLFGSTTSTQSSIIVPYPGKDSLYYIFTVDGPNAGTLHGLCYSIVDMDLNSGLGGVISTFKNIRIGTFYPTEKLTSVSHTNLRDIWVIAHEWGTNSFYTHLVTVNGIETTPVISKVGTSHGTTQDKDNINISKGTGYLKVSPDGKKLALAIFGANTIEILNFDNSTGVVSVPVMTDKITQPYGVEFSSDGTKAYFGTTRNTNVSDRTYIYQYNLLASNITLSKTQVAESDHKAHHFGALQLAPDGKIYVAQYDHNTIPIINNPNNLGIDCNFVNNAFSLATNAVCKFGFPNFIQSSIVDGTITTTATKPPSAKQCESCIYSFAPEPGKKYVISAWVKEEDADPAITSFAQPRITIQYPGLPSNPGLVAKINAENFKANGNIIDGWQRIEEEFEIPANAVEISIKLECLRGNCFFDDIRFHPFDATMKSFVYDPVTLKLTAILDENNFATFFEYDEEGKPIRVKKETERGIMTIKENRNSLIK